MGLPRSITPMRPSPAVAALLALLAVMGPPEARSAQRAGAVGPVPVLMYHHVARTAPFERQMAALARAGYRAVTLERMWSAWHGGPALPRSAVVLTFDDGYADQYSRAWPVLAARGWPAVLNLTVSRLDQAGYLTSPQVSTLTARGWEVAAHTLTHPDLRRVRARRLAHEVAGSRAALERRFGLPVRFFCYPFGRSDARVRAAVRAAGFLAATSIRPGAAAPWDDPLTLRRIAIRASDGAARAPAPHRRGNAQRAQTRGAAMSRPVRPLRGAMAACAAALLAAGVAAAAAPVAQAPVPRCFGAASRDPQRPCRNPRLRHMVVPTPGEARRGENAPCDPVERVGQVGVCAFGAPAESASSTIALVGDSHAAHLRAALTPVAVARGWHGVSLTQTGCPLTRATKILREPLFSECKRWNVEVVDWLTNHPEVRTVVVSQIVSRVGVIPAPGRTKFATEVAGYAAAWRALPASVQRIVVVRGRSEGHARRPGVRRARARGGSPGGVRLLGAARRRARARPGHGRRQTPPVEPRGHDRPQLRLLRTTPLLSRDRRRARLQGSASPHAGLLADARADPRTPAGRGRTGDAGELRSAAAC